MKSLLKIAFSLIAALCVFTACDDSDDAVTGFNLDTEEITLGAEGGASKVNVSAGTKWVAKSDQPWVQIMPANGVGSAECQIVVDSTLRNDIRNATITFQPEGVSAQKLEVHQTGFGKMIGVNIEEVIVESMKDRKQRYFDITVTTNVDFDVNIETSAEQKNWIVKPDYSVNLEAGARPRTTKLRFEWAMNTDPKERLAEIGFIPKKPEDADAKAAQVKVTQKAAPFIGDNRAGDSLALIILQEKMNCMAKFETSEKMEYWPGVTLWERKDKEVIANPTMQGRVRSAIIGMLATQEPIPAEIAKLTYVETLSISSNSNTMLIKNLSPGTDVCKLKYLKHLRIFSYGIETLPNEFKELGGTLESLDLGSNNFEKIPTVLTKENFPKLISLDFSGMRRYGSTPNLKTESREKPGLVISASDDAIKRLLKWENLKELDLAYNMIYGVFPNMTGWDDGDVPKYTDADIAANDTLKNARDVLVGTPKILPNAVKFSINLNFISGAIPNWVKYHPHLSQWGPFSFMYPQDGGYDMAGKVPGFTDVPANLDYYYTLYPLRKPTYTEE